MIAKLESIHQDCQVCIQESAQNAKDYVALLHFLTRYVALQCVLHRTLNIKKNLAKPKDKLRFNKKKYKNLIFLDLNDYSFQNLKF